MYFHWCYDCMSHVIRGCSLICLKTIRYADDLTKWFWETFATFAVLHTRCLQKMFATWAMPAVTNSNSFGSIALSGIPVLIISIINMVWMDLLTTMEQELPLYNSFLQCSTVYNKTDNLPNIFLLTLRCFFPAYAGGTLCIQYWVCLQVF